jgi:uracil phosphoribosyltransferase
MLITIVSHPLVTHKLSILRDKSTASPIFRQLVEELVTLLAYEATRDMTLCEAEVITPLTTTRGSKLAAPRPIIIPVLRAGLGMLEGMMKLLPTAEVGFLGIKRDDETLQPFTYANRLPQNLGKRQVFIIDPMLATGGTLNDPIDYVFERKAKNVTCVCLIGAPEGVENVQNHLAKRWPGRDVHIVLGALDEKLNEIGYIVPGLGDAGDRLYGVAD